MARMIFKKTGKRGGLTIPAVLRREMGLQEGDPVEITLQDNNHIEIKQYTPRCVFCGSNDQVQEIGGKGICRNCCRKVGELKWN